MKDERLEVRDAGCYLCCEFDSVIMIWKMMLKEEH